METSKRLYIIGITVAVLLSVFSLRYSFSVKEFASGLLGARTSGDQVTSSTIATAGGSLITGTTTYRHAIVAGNDPSSIIDNARVVSSTFNSQLWINTSSQYAFNVCSVTGTPCPFRVDSRTTGITLDVGEDYPSVILGGNNRHVSVDGSSSFAQVQVQPGVLSTNSFESIFIASTLNIKGGVQTTSTADVANSAQLLVGDIGGANRMWGSNINFGLAVLMPSVALGFTPTSQHFGLTVFTPGSNVSLGNASTAIDAVASLQLSALTYENSSVVRDIATDFDTFTIAGAPILGSNVTFSGGRPKALNVKSGMTYLGGNVGWGYREIAATTTLALDDSLVVVTGATASVTAVLPNAASSTEGAMYCLKDGDGSLTASKKIILTAVNGTDLFDGAQTISTTVAWDNICVVSNGATRYHRSFF